jgi:hypothetical protein
MSFVTKNKYALFSLGLYFIVFSIIYLLFQDQNIPYGFSMSLIFYIAGTFYYFKSRKLKEAGWLNTASITIGVFYFLLFLAYLSFAYSLSP